MQKKIINLVTYVLTFGLCIFLIWYSFKDLTAEQIDKIKFAVSKANYILLLPILIMGVISHWSRAVRWRYLMEPLGMQPSIANTFFAVMIGYITNLMLPRAGEVIKCSILAKYEKTPVDKLVGTIIAERAFDMLCLVLIFVLTFLVQIDLATDYTQTLISKMNHNQNGEKSYTSYIVLACIVLVSILLYAFRKTIGKIAFFQKLKSVFQNILSGILSFKDMRNKKGFILHTFLIWAMYLGMIVLGFQSISETNMLGYKTGLSVLSFGSIGMIVTPGGLGAYPLIVQEIVSLYLVNDSEGIISKAISWIIWLVPTVITILLGIISLILIPFYNRNKHASQ